MRCRPMAQAGVFLWVGMFPSQATFGEAGHPLVLYQEGTVPVILSVPHGGDQGVLNCPPRTGQSLPQKAHFVTTRDTGTKELALELAKAIQKRTGQSPYLVVLLAHRKYLDGNRPAEKAYEAQPAQAVYEAYHQALDKACREVQRKFSAGLLLDIHGQGTAPDTIFRGTAAGKTVQRLRDRFGEQAYTGPESLFGWMKSAGLKVHPDPLDGKEASAFSGGYIVRRYGGLAFQIDAYQLEFGRNYRVQQARAKTSNGVAEAVEKYLTRYLDFPRPASPVSQKSPPAEELAP